MTPKLHIIEEHDVKCTPALYEVPQMMTGIISKHLPSAAGARSAAWHNDSPPSMCLSYTVAAVTPCTHCRQLVLVAKHYELQVDANVSIDLPEGCPDRGCQEYISLDKHAGCQGSQHEQRALRCRSSRGTSSVVHHTLRADTPSICKYNL